MKVSDPVNRAEEASTMTFEDFLEALCRSCDFMSIPTDADLVALGCKTASEWDARVDPETRVAARRGSVGWMGTSERPLGEKLGKFMSIFLARYQAEKNRILK
jgi:hypothetical protein